ncbi:ABC transporter ATP-binding protein [Maricaulaceae bacterium EIL42A08]|nr:ABC transporter ATP-binding protein [Maricaulaceae bacterium EIL42A08]
MPLIQAKNVSLSYPILGIGPVLSKAEGTASSDNPPSASTGALLSNAGTRVKTIDALRDISFELKPGDRLGLLGRNGSGKSTLLRVLAGVYPPTKGEFTTQGRLAPIFNVGLGVRPEATGRRNIILRGLLNGLSTAESKSKVDEIVEFSELGPYIDMPVRTYSSGMAMRLAFATATAFSPEILLLDEWIGAGDEDFQKKAAARMSTLVTKAGITVIASHKRNLIKQVCTLGLWLDGGEMRAFGPIDDVYEQWDEHNRRANAPLIQIRRTQPDPPPQD